MQKKRKSFISACTAASVLMASSAVLNVSAAAITTNTNQRLWGQDRYETAVKVSQVGWNQSDYAVIASGEGYADALCAAPLAKFNNAPILLTEGKSLNSTTLQELKRLNVKHVYIVGGQGVVSSEIEDTIKSQVTSDVQRFWGQDRYGTSVKVAEKLGVQGKIVLASGEGYADALSAAPVASIEGMPILLTASKALSSVTGDYIKRNTNITKTYVIGGYASVSDDTMNSVPGAQRLGGADRYETNTAVINNFAADFSFNNVYIALGNGPQGNEFADALTGSAIAAKNKNPLIIVGKELSNSTQALIKAKLTTSSTITVLGGSANVSDELIGSIGNLTVNGSTGGSGSSGSSGETTYTNITVVVKQVLQNKYNSELSSNPSIQNYVKVDATGDTVKVQLQKENIESLESVFNTGKQQDTSTLVSRLNKVQDQLNVLEDSSSLQIDGISLKDTLAKVNSAYINKDGSLNTAVIAEEIKSSTLTYDEFRNELKTRMEEEIAQRSVDTDKTAPNITIEGINLDKIVDANDKTVYDSSWTRSQAVDKLVNLVDINSTLGSYKVYSGKSYFNITIQ